MASVQLWKCSKCGTEYNSPLAISSVTCKKRGCQAAMKFTEGKPPKWLAEKEKREASKKKRSVRVKATRASTPGDLMTLLGDTGE